MKKNHQHIVILLGIVMTMHMGVPRIYAQTGTATPSAKVTPAESPSPVATSSVEIFKEKIAQKVAELSRDTKKALAGYVTKIEKDILEVTTHEGKSVKVIIDDTLTKIYTAGGTEKKEQAITTIKKDAFVVAFGPIIEDSLNANYIYKTNEYIVGSGKLTSVDKTAYTIKVTTTANEEYTFDVETSTKQLILDTQTLKITTSGFSKYKEGDVIHFVAKKTVDTAQTRLPAASTLIIPQAYFTQEY